MMVNNEKAVDVNNFEQRVGKKAYELYKKKGSKDGYDWDDWLEAEKIVGSEISTVDRDCIRSESFFEVTHRPDASPSYIDPQNLNKSPVVKDF